MSAPEPDSCEGRVEIREVGPRDGLQAEAPVQPTDRAALVAALIGAGCRRVEVASFVSEKAVPAMAGAAAVVDAVNRHPDRQSVVVTALVPNLRGAQAALGHGVDEITVTVAASPTYNERNVRRSIDESVAEIELVSKAASEADVPVDAVVSCAFGSPYEAEIPPASVARLTGQLMGAGVSAITLADTTGVATPRSITDVLGVVSGTLTGRAGGAPGLHLHETRGTAMLNAWCALQAGVTRFDTAVGGLGGSPFAEGAGGNLATEDFVSLLHRLGYSTGIDLDLLLEAQRLVATLVGHDLPSKVRDASAILGA